MAQTKRPDPEAERSDRFTLQHVPSSEKLHFSEVNLSFCTTVRRHGRQVGRDTEELAELARLQTTQP